MFVLKKHAGKFLVITIRYIVNINFNKILIIQIAIYFLLGEEFSSK